MLNGKAVVLVGRRHRNPSETRAPMNLSMSVIRRTRPVFLETFTITLPLANCHIPNRIVRQTVQASRRLIWGAGEPNNSVVSSTFLALKPQ